MKSSTYSALIAVKNISWISSMIYILVAPYIGWSVIGIAIGILAIAPFAISVLFVLMLHCASCGNPIYDGSTVWKAPYHGFGRFRECPKCGATLEDGSIIMKAAPGRGALVPTTRKTFFFGGGLGFVMGVVLVVAHYQFRVPIIDTGNVVVGHEATSAAFLCVPFLLGGLSIILGLRLGKN